jgi:hypothetical protein
MLKERCSPGVMLAAAFIVLMAPAGGAAAGPVVGCEESATNPIKACWDTDTPEDQQMAVETVADADEIYGLLVDDVGLSVPWRLDEAGSPEPGLYIFITTLDEDIAGYAEPVADVPSTPNADCAVTLNINRTSGFFGRFTLRHEMGHAMQMADDCVEAVHEGLVMYLTLLIVKLQDPDRYERMLEWMGGEYMGTFQSNPYMALDYDDPFNTELSMYPFGHSLFDMYIDERWGNGLGSIIGEISRATRQDGTVVITDGVPALAAGENEPDLYDAIDTTLAEDGGSFWDAVKEFSIWRIYTGPDLADANHFEYGASLPGIVVDSVYGMGELPITDAVPMNGPAETGSSYINLTIDPISITGPSDLVQLNIASIDSMNWYLAAVVTATDENRIIETDVTGGRGMLVASDLASAVSVMFVVTNLGDLTHDPDDADYNQSTFIFDLDFYTTPTLEGVQPGQVIQGQEGVEVEITGSGLKPGIHIDLGTGIDIVESEVETGGDTITATIDADPDAPVGWHALRVFYDNGLEAQLPEGLEVLTGEGPVITSVNPASAWPGDEMNVEIVGQRFQDRMTATFSGGDILVDRVDVIDEGSAIAAVRVISTAIPGAKDVTITNPDRKGFTLEDGFTILTSEDAGDGEDEEGGGGDKGCGCSIVM